MDTLPPFSFVRYTRHTDHHPKESQIYSSATPVYKELTPLHDPLPFGLGGSFRALQKGPKNLSFLSPRVNFFSQFSFNSVMATRKEYLGVPAACFRTPRNESKRPAASIGEIRSALPSDDHTGLRSNRNKVLGEG